MHTPRGLRQVGPARGRPRRGRGRRSLRAWKNGRSPSFALFRASPLHVCRCCEQATRRHADPQPHPHAQEHQGHHSCPGLEADSPDRDPQEHASRFVARFLPRAGLILAVNGMLRTAIECVNARPLVFLPNAPVTQATALTLPSGKKFFLRSDGAVAGVTEEELLAAFPDDTQ